MFRDFLNLSTCSLSQPFYRSPEIEEEYRKTISNYTHEQAEIFPKLLALLVSALEFEFQDFLGQIYMSLNLGNAKNGQFFTPYHVSQMMAEINLTDIENQLADRDFVTLSEPCSGAGGMVIAFAESLKKQGYNYQYQLFVEATDIDELCFMMTYIQLSLYGIPARVVLGDTLTLKFQKFLYTPMYFINGFYWRLKTKNEEPKKELPEAETLKIPVQLQLF